MTPKELKPTEAAQEKEWTWMEEIQMWYWRPPYSFTAIETFESEVLRDVRKERQK